MAALADARHATDLEAADEEELLLIVAGLGLPPTDHKNNHDAPPPPPPQPYLLGTDASECIADLQRYLRRDDPMLMATHRALGTWKTMQNHLLPMLSACVADTHLVFNVLKVIVKLTMKPEQLAFKMEEYMRERKAPDPAINRQLDELRGYHRAYTRAFATPANVGILVRLLAKPLAAADGERSEEETMVVELVLALLLNLLHTWHPDAPPFAVSDREQALEGIRVLRELVTALDVEHGLELLTYVIQQVEESESFRAWNLSLLETLYYVLSAHSPADVAEEHSSSGGAAAAAVDVGSDVDPLAVADGKATSVAAAQGDRTEPRRAGRYRAGTLQGLQSSWNVERRQIRSVASARHGNFGGSFKVRSVFGDRDHVLGNVDLSAAPNISRHRRPPRNRMPLPGEIQPRREPRSEAAVRSLAAALYTGPLNSLMATVLEDLEGHAFGRQAFNASKVLPQDHIFFCATATWFLDRHRLHEASARRADRGRPFDVAPVGALVEVRVFNLALRLCREYEEKKMYMQLGVAVGLLKQLFMLLDELVKHGKGDVRRVALLLRRNVFYEGEVRKLIDSLIKAYEPFRMRVSYLHDVILCAHAALNQLEAHGRSGDLVARKRRRRKKRKQAADAAAAAAAAAAAGGTEGAATSEPPPPEPADDPADDDDVPEGEYQTEEVALDFEHELIQFAGDKHVIKRYVLLLRDFTNLPADVAHAIVVFMTRLVKQCKLEAMLFQVELLQTFDMVLSHPEAKRQRHREVVSACTAVTRRFFDVATDNPAVFAEALFWTRPGDAMDVVSGYTERNARKKKAQEPGLEAYDARAGERDVDADFDAARDGEDEPSAGGGGRWSKAEIALLRKEFPNYRYEDDYDDLLAMVLAPRSADEGMAKKRVRAVIESDDESD